MAAAQNSSQGSGRNAQRKRKVTGLCVGEQGKSMTAVFTSKDPLGVSWESRLGENGNTGGHVASVNAKTVQSVNV